MSALVQLVKGDDPSLVSGAATKLIDELVGERDRAICLDEPSLAQDGIRGLVDAAMTVPFLTDRRVVVARDLGKLKDANFTPLIEYIEDPNPSTIMVLTGETDFPKKVQEAIKKHGVVHSVGAPRRASERAPWIASEAKRRQVDLDRASVVLIDSQIGEDVSRIVGLLDLLASAFGDRRLGVADVAPYLNEAGGVAPWLLTDAIDKGDVAGALEAQRRLALNRGALGVLATLSTHFMRMLTLDGVSVRNEAEAAELLGMRGSSFPAKKALTQARKLGGARIKAAVSLLAEADLDFRGIRDLPDDVLMEVLVTRLTRLSRV